jgi:hypothetical protein
VELQRRRPDPDEIRWGSDKGPLIPRIANWIVWPGRALLVRTTRFGALKKVMAAVAGATMVATRSVRVLDVNLQQCLRRHDASQSAALDSDA